MEEGRHRQVVAAAMSTSRVDLIEGCITGDAWLCAYQESSRRGEPAQSELVSAAIHPDIGGNISRLEEFHTEDRTKLISKQGLTLEYTAAKKRAAAAAAGAEEHTVSERASFLLKQP